MDEDEYAGIAKKPLKLNKDKKDKKRKHTSEYHKQPIPALTKGNTQVIISTTTKAEEAFNSKRQKIVEERILKKATKTHKQRVEEFNKHLDSLSEHYDIPKVSWTK